MKLSVERSKYDNLATEGQLFVDGLKFCFTLEPGKKDPDRPKGPIPAGTYEVLMQPSPHFDNKEMPHLQNVPGFEYIMIHPGNLPHQSEGCIMVGLTQGVDFIGSSRDAFNQLLPKIIEGLKIGKVYCDVIG